MQYYLYCAMENTVQFRIFYFRNEIQITMLFNKQKLSLSPTNPHLKEILNDILQCEKSDLRCKI